MLYFLDLDRQDWTSSFDGATLTQALRRGDPWLRPPQAPELTDALVELPLSLAEFPGFDQGIHERPRYGYSDAWQELVTVRALRAAAFQASHLPQSSSTILSNSPVASLKAPHMPLAFQAPSTLGPGESLSRSFAAPPTLAALASAYSGLLLPHFPSCRHPSRVLPRRPRQNPLGAHRCRHLVGVTSSLRCRSRAHPLQQP